MRLAALASTLLLLFTAFAAAQGTGVNTGGGAVVDAGGGTGIGAGGDAGEAINQSNAATGLTGNRETALQTDGFLGANQGGGFLGQTGGGTTGQQNQQFGNAGNFGGGRGGNAAGGGRQPQQQQQSNRQIRIKLVIPPDFGIVEIPPREIQTKLTTQFRKVSQLKTLNVRGRNRISTSGLRGSNVSASSDNYGVVTLTGRVSNPRERRIAERMAKMEPGVRSVVNQLTVSP